MKKLMLIMIFVSALGFSNAQQSNHWTTITGTQYNLTMSGVIYINDIARHLQHLRLEPSVATSAVAAHGHSSSRLQATM